jgi:transcriptional regulator with XRE-family HTH domain
MSHPTKSHQSTAEARRALLKQNRFDKVSDIVRTNIANRRIAAGMTQRQLAESSGISQGAIHQLETGRVGRERQLVRFSMTAVNAVAKTLRVPVWSLFIPEIYLETVEGTNWQSLAAAIGQLPDASDVSRSSLAKMIAKK